MPPVYSSDDVSDTDCDDEEMPQLQNMNYKNAKEEMKAPEICKNRYHPTSFIESKSTKLVADNVKEIVAVPLVEKTEGKNLPSGKNIILCIDLATGYMKLWLFFYDHQHFPNIWIVVQHNVSVCGHCFVSALPDSRTVSTWHCSIARPHIIRGSVITPPPIHITCPHANQPTSISIN